MTGSLEMVRRPGMTGSPSAVRVRDVHVALRGRPVLRGVDLAVRPGELMALVGPNGAGKSTLLAAVCGDLPITAGQVCLAGRPLPDWTVGKLARQRAMLPQRGTVSFPFTVREVVRMGRAPWARTPQRAADEQAVAEAMCLTEVTDLADRAVSTLSGGEQARVALARVLAQRTPVLLLDEPTAALDLRHQELVLTLARQRARDGDAVLVVLHDLSLAAAYADSVALLCAGELVGAGPPEQVLTPEVLSRVYRHDIEVIAHPDSGLPLVLPNRLTLTQERWK